jgi:hypothetical protein
MGRHPFVLVALLLLLHSAAAFNKTFFSYPPHKRVADTVADAAAVAAPTGGDEYYVKLPAPATWPEVAAAISALTAASNGACAVRSVTQASFQTSMVVVCTDVSAADIQALMNTHVAPLWGVANVGALVVPNERYAHAAPALVQANAPVHLDVLDTPINAGPPYVRDQLFHYAYRGVGIRAFVIDTGVVASHGEFGGRAHEWLNTVDNSGRFSPLPLLPFPSNT